VTPRLTRRWYFIDTRRRAGASLGTLPHWMPEWIVRTVRRLMGAPDYTRPKES
jgi:hypothetical protein